MRNKGRNRVQDTWPAGFVCDFRAKGQQIPSENLKEVLQHKTKILKMFASKNDAPQSQRVSCIFDHQEHKRWYTCGLFQNKPK